MSYWLFPIGISLLLDTASSSLFFVARWALEISGRRQAAAFQGVSKDPNSFFLKQTTFEGDYIKPFSLRNTHHGST